jgi:hypothetical protein
MPTLTATQVLPPGQVTTIFDWTPIPQFGIPFWVVISGFLFLILLIVIRYWWKRSSRLNSIRGWKESLMKMSQFDVQVWIVSRVQKLTIECLTIKDNVLSYYDESNIGMWHVNSSMGIIRVGGNPAVMISEDYDQNRDILTELAVCHGADNANENMPEMAKQLDEKYKAMIASKDISPEEIPNPALLCQPIENADSYDQTGHELLKQLHPNGIIIPPYNIFNPNRFRKYFPRGTSAMFFGGELIRDSQKLNQGIEEPSWLSKNAIVIICMVLAVIAILIGYQLPLKVGG